jgi:high-affinity iron transporter
MLATAIIVFREVLEAALIVGIVLAASRGIAHRGAWITGGIAGGGLGAVLVAAGAGTIQAAAAGMGQELLNAAILLAAVAMLGWHNIWMTTHGREMAVAANRLGSEVRTGARPLWALALVVGLAVLREGSEIVLFLYGVAATDGEAGGMALGGALGLAGGVAAGAALYLGLISIPLRHLFAVTGWMILLLAAGMAAQAAAFLVQADLLPPLGNQLWDTSFLLSDGSLIGKVLHTLVGYTAQPAGIQLVFYLATLIVIGGLMWAVGSRSQGGADGSAGDGPGRPDRIIASGERVRRPA